MFISIFISLTFLLAAGSKVVDITKFADTLSELQISSVYVSSKVIAILVIVLEIITGCLTLMNGVLGLIGLSLATGLMLVFTVVIIRILYHDSSQHCNCFGNSNRPVNSLDLVRNVGLCACSIIGLCIGQSFVELPTNKIEIGVLGFLSLTVAVVWINLGNIYHAQFVPS